jgi:hypothetical protein
MTTILITKQIESEHGFYFEATCGKTTAQVAIHSDRVQVICLNAMHKVARGPGRVFPSVSAAIQGYKKAEMRAIIEAAADAVSH